MRLKTFRGGIHPEGHKEQSKGQPVRAYLPKGELVFPVSQHIGKPARPVVAKGDPVLAGQIIAEADGFVSANIISSCSGTVKAIEERHTASGARAVCIVIENDGQYTLAPGIGKTPHNGTLSSKDILDAIKAAGIVGMGGAGFPTHVKLTSKNPEAIDYVIANGSECEPYITCDDRLMQDENRSIVEGLRLVLQLFPNAQGVIAIEDNKPDAIRAMEAVCAGEKQIFVQPVLAKYPEGGERNLISVISGRDLRFGQLPADVGCMVCNVATLHAIYRAVHFSEPLMERYFTVSGDAVASPCTMKVRIGTSAAELIEAAGGVKEGCTVKKVLSGGPMMGIALSALDVPVCKNNNALTVLAHDEVEKAQQQLTACIRCGRCTRACPIHLTPQMMADAAEHGDYEQFEKRLYGLDCFACGSCTYVCPAKRPLMQLFKQTKAAILAAKRK
ncbi:electron transport complex subunit RsxC [Parablautia sp. Marseille-Q6255]|uniref:electron transport complex subunit RsxC n=1 Tax=Parablautia sp. Marseille-Q6255 TaxID=3039593 RepID=UPI0024BCB838|nr:electron transport complex subunit RsxC [Parablautia sp. Marseille-Q6255]